MKSVAQVNPKMTAVVGMVRGMRGDAPIKTSCLLCEEIGVGVGVGQLTRRLAFYNKKTPPIVAHNNLFQLCKFLMFWMKQDQSAVGGAHLQRSDSLSSLSSPSHAPSL